MPRRNNRDQKRDPRERKFLAGDPTDDLYIKPLRRRDKWRRNRVEDSGPESTEDDDGSDE